MANPTVPTRLQVPDPATNAVIQDIYDKLQQVLGQDTPITPVTPVTPVTPNVTINISGASGQATTPQFAFIPELVVMPSNNPNTGAPYAQDGLLIEFNKQFRRYNLSTFNWDYAGTATAILSDTHANRVANYLPAGYLDALFLESDTLILLWSSGTEWNTISGHVTDTHADRLTSWPSVQYSPGTPFFESDRTVFYVVADAVGTVTTAGTAVTWISGDHFINTGTGFDASQWPAGTPIVIDGITYLLASVASPTAATLATSAGIQAGVAYSVDSGRWVYQSGQYSDALANLPTDLGENDELFLFFENAAYFHQLQWTGTAWRRGPEDEEHSDTFHEFGAVPTDGGWYPCDGTGTTYMQYTGTTAARTVPDWNGTPAFARGGPTYSDTITAPAPPTIGGTTDAAATGITVSGAAVSTGTADVGLGQPVVTALTDPGGAVTDPTHTHNLSGIAPISLPGPPVSWSPVIKMYRR